MIRRVLLMTIVAVAGSAILATADQRATFILTNGQRASGELSYGGGNDLTLTTNGRAHNYTWSDLALIAFDDRDPTAAELRELPETANPPDLRRHMVVLRDGKVLHGKIWKFAPDGSSVWLDSEGGQRREIPAGQVARVYITPTDARHIYAPILNAETGPTGSGQPATPGPNSVVVQANRPWTDTGITVRRGNRVTFETSGTIQIANGGVSTSPDGNPQYGPRPSYPVAGAQGGVLIGRIGNGRPFVIGSNSQPITMPANGRLFLGINDDNFGDNSGWFTVTIGR